MNTDFKETAEKYKNFIHKYRSVLLIIVLGAVLMLLPTGRERDGPKQEPAGTEEQFEIHEFEKRMEDTLSRIEGAGKVHVMVTLSSGSRTILAQDAKREPESSSSTVVTVSGGGGAQEVVPTQVLSPNFRGVLVVCPGGENAGVRLRLVQAVTALTGLRSDQISVCASTDK